MDMGLKPAWIIDAACAASPNVDFAAAAQQRKRDNCRLLRSQCASLTDCSESAGMSRRGN
eukprot:1811546-Pleurochrysis_carterae.AAC.1